MKLTMKAIAAAFVIAASAATAQAAPVTVAASIMKDAAPVVESQIEAVALVCRRYNYNGRCISYRSANTYRVVPLYTYRPVYRTYRTYGYRTHGGYRRW